jgi:hypothetical protein
MIDAIHHAAHRARTRTLDAALDLLKDAGIDNDPQFLAALEAVLEVEDELVAVAGLYEHQAELAGASGKFDSAQLKLPVMVL